MRARKLDRLIWLGVCIGLVVSFGLAAAEDNPDVIVFYREECNDCRHMDEILDELVLLYPEIFVAHIEETEPGATDLMWALSVEYGIFPSKFPVIFVGDEVIVGVGRDKELLLRSTVQGCIFNDCPSPVDRLEREPFPIVIIGIMLAVLVTAAALLLF